jgi:membrane protein implicated in regulation of membrane protease activity
MDVSNSVFLSLGAWTWLVAGFALMAIELIAPGTIFLWFGLAAIATGMIALGIGLPWQVQIALFGLLSATSLWAWWTYRRQLNEPVGDATLNDRAQRHVGRRFILSEPIVSGAGRVKMDDTVWRIAGPDCPAGTEIEVVGVDGSVLKVVPRISA